MKSPPTEFGRRITEGVGLNQTELAHQLSIRLGTLVRPSAIQYLAQKANSSRLTADIAAICRVNYRWLARGEGPKGGFRANTPEERLGEEPPHWKDYYPDDDTHIEELEKAGEGLAREELEDALEPASELKGRLIRAPVVGTASLGLDGFWSELEYPVGHGDGFVMHPSTDPNTYALMVKGDSMYPAIRSGFIVIVEPNAVPVAGEFVVVKLRDGRSTVKELLWQRGDEYTLQAVNGQMRMTIRADEVEFVHPVAAIVPPSRRTKI